MINFIKKYLPTLMPAFLLAAFLPLPAFALTGCPVGIGGVICEIKGILGSLLPLLISFAVIYIVWGIIRFVIADSEEAKTKGKDVIIYGIIGLTVIISMWGLVNILVTTFDLDAAAPSFSDIGIEQSVTTPSNPIENLLVNIQGLVNSLIPLLIAIGVIFFIWGVIRYLIADSEEAKSKGKDQIIYGIIGFTVILGLWGLVNILVSTFDLQKSAPDLEPLTVSAGENCSLEGKVTLKSVLCYFTKLINDSVIPLIFAVATLFFVWGAVKFFIIHADEEAKREQGKQFMIWSIIAFAVMLSVWGLVALLGGTLNIKTNALPQVRPSTSGN